MLWGGFFFLKKNINRILNQSRVSRIYKKVDPVTSELAEKNVPMEKKKKTTSLRCCRSPKTNSCSDLRKTHISKTFANVNKFIRLWGKKSSPSPRYPTGSGIGGVRGTHLCQPFTERGDPRMGLILTDDLLRLRVSLLCGPVGGGEENPKIQKTLRCQDRSSMRGQCVSARQQKHQQETWFRATGRVWGTISSCTSDFMHTHSPASEPKSYKLYRW